VADEDFAQTAPWRRPQASAPAEASPFHPSFAVVLGAAQRGDQAAFEQIFSLLNQRLHGYVRVRGAADPEGIVNEVFLRVFAGLDGFDGNENQFRAWLFTIARNKLIDEQRRRQRRPEEVLSDQVLTDAVGDAEIDALARLGDGWVHEQLAMLTAEQRDVLLLRIVSDLTVDSVAQVLGKQPSAVKALQRRALRTLSRRWNQQAAPL
jgi:RNA polymerase sigma-70 factor (ECF subfamily)